MGGDDVRPSSNKSARSFIASSPAGSSGTGSGGEGVNLEVNPQGLFPD